MIDILLQAMPDAAAAVAQPLISEEFCHMLIRLVVNFVVLGVLVHFLYYPKSQRRDFYFTFMLVGVAIFFLVFFMMFVLEDMKGKTSIGIGIGLFGIFSIMRYRTETMPVREMTYLFLIISISVINALAENVTYLELAIVNIAVAAATWYFEHHFGQKNIHQKLIQYDRIELVKPENRDRLIADLEERVGLPIQKVEVGGIDFLRDAAMIKIYYEAKDESDNTVNDSIKMRGEEWRNVQS